MERAGKQQELYFIIVLRATQNDKQSLLKEDKINV